MTTTFQEFPVLTRFFCAVETQTRTGMSNLRAEKQDDTSTIAAVDQTPKKLPKGIVLGPDGKPFVTLTPFTCIVSKALTQSQMSIVHLIRRLGPTEQREVVNQVPKGIS